MGVFPCPSLLQSPIVGELKIRILHTAFISAPGGWESGHWFRDFRPLGTAGGVAGEGIGWMMELSEGKKIATSLTGWLCAYFNFIVMIRQKL